MKFILGGVLSAGATIALIGAASAQTAYYDQNTPGFGQQGTVFQQPGTTFPQQGTVFQQPGTSFPQQGTVFQQPGTTFPQQGTVFQQPGTSFPQAGTVLQQPSTSFPQPGTVFQQPSATFPQAGTVFQQPGTSFPQQGTVFQQPSTTFPQTGSTAYAPSIPQPQPYIPPNGIQQSTAAVLPPLTTAPANPNPAPQRPEIGDTDAWTFAFARFYPAIRACLRNVKSENPVIANIQERRNATVMLIGTGGTADYQVCRTGLRGTRVRDGNVTRGLPPAFYAPLGTSFTISPERPFQPVVDTSNRLLGWIVRTAPVRLDVTGGRGFDGQFIRPITVNPNAQ